MLHGLLGLHCGRGSFDGLQRGDGHWRRHRPRAHGVGSDAHGPIRFLLLLRLDSRLRNWFRRERNRILHRLWDERRLAIRMNRCNGGRRRIGLHGRFWEKNRLVALHRAHLRCFAGRIHFPRWRDHSRCSWGRSEGSGRFRRLITHLRIMKCRSGNGMALCVILKTKRSGVIASI